MSEVIMENSCFYDSSYSFLYRNRAIDMGCPQLSMHSIRETMGVKDFTHGLALFRAYFKNFSTIDERIEG